MGKNVACQTWESLTTNKQAPDSGIHPTKQTLSNPNNLLFGTSLPPPSTPFS